MFNLNDIVMLNLGSSSLVAGLVDPLAVGPYIVTGKVANAAATTARPYTGTFVLTVRKVLLVVSSTAVVAQAVGPAIQMSDLDLDYLRPGTEYQEALISAEGTLIAGSVTIPLPVGFFECKNDICVAERISSGGTTGDLTAAYDGAGANFVVTSTNALDVSHVRVIVRRQKWEPA